MTSVIIVAKRNALILPCLPHPEADGFSWHCPACSGIVARVSFGIMNGVWRCRCGAEIEMCVDGVPIDLQRLTIEDKIGIAKAMAHSEEQGSQIVNVIPFPERITARDKEFLEACNIALDDDGDEPA